MLRNIAKVIATGFAIESFSLLAGCASGDGEQALSGILQGIGLCLLNGSLLGVFPLRAPIDPHQSPKVLCRAKAACGFRTGRRGSQCG